VRTEDLGFFSGPGLRLAARVYRPDPMVDRKAGVVFCHGFTGTKGGTPPPLAGPLAEHGYTVLTFDYRGFGGSEGIAGRLLPDEQVEDVGHAIEFLLASGWIDPEKLGIYGNSFGGGVALRAAARSGLAKALVISVPVVSGRAWLRAINRWYEFQALETRARAAIAHKARTGEFERVHRLEIMVPDAITKARYPEEVTVTLETFWHVLHHEPLREIGDFDLPTIVLGVERDQLVPCEQAQMLYDRLRGPKAIHVFDDDDHFAVYSRLLPEVIKKATGWFDQYIGFGRS
jgi:dipeptidyl aminopeptidase/acylaminoacyl peptidase